MSSLWDLQREIKNARRRAQRAAAAAAGVVEKPVDVIMWQGKELKKGDVSTKEWNRRKSIYLQELKHAARKLGLPASGGINTIVGNIVHKTETSESKKAKEVKKEKLIPPKKKAEYRAKNKPKKEAKKAPKSEIPVEKEMGIPPVNKVYRKVYPDYTVYAFNSQTRPEKNLKAVEKYHSKDFDGTNKFVVSKVADDEYTEVDKIIFPKYNLFTRKNLEEVLKGHMPFYREGGGMETYREVAESGMYIYVYNFDFGPTDLSMLESTKVNCVIDAIDKFYEGKVPAAIKKSLDEVIRIYKLDEGTPVNKQCLDDMATKCRLRFIVYSAVKGVWHDTDLHTKYHRKTIEIFSYGNHGSLYVPIRPLKKCTVVYGDPEEETKDLHQHKRYYATRVKTNNQNVFECLPPEAIHTGDVFVKSFKPSSVTGNENDDKMPEYYRCLNKDQFTYRKWILDNRLRPLEAPYFEAFKNADSHLTSQKFEEIDELVHWSMDMNRAYPSFKTNPLYEKYKLILGYVCAYNTSNVPINQLLDLPGISFVDEIEYHNDFVSMTNWIQPGQWYNHICLFVLVSEGWATIKVSQSIICRRSEDLEFPFTDDKLHNNSFIGRLVAGASANSREEYTVTNPADTSQVLFEYDKNPDCHGCLKFPKSENEHYIVASMKAECNKKQMHHIHNCILAYQQVTMMKMMVRVIKEGGKIIAYNTDGFHMKTKTPIENSLAPGHWKFEQSRIKYQTSFEGMRHHAGQKFYDEFLPEYYPETPTCLTIGPAGCGKSYKKIEKNPGMGSVVLCPINQLVCNTKKKLRSHGVYTYQKYFGLYEGCGYHKQKIHEVVIIDEISMVPPADLWEIIEKCKKNRVCLDLIGDIHKKANNKWTTIQRKPVTKGVNKKLHDKKLTDVISDNMSIRVVISDVRRQSKEDAEWIDRLREMSLKEMRECLIARFGLFRFSKVMDQNATGISATHYNCNLFSTAIINAYKPAEVPARLLKSRKSQGEVIEAKGNVSMQPIKKVWCDRVKGDQVTPKKYPYELAYFRTADAVQGQSIEGKIVIDISDCDKRFLYTAVSRCRRLEDIIIVGRGMKEVAPSA